MASLFLKPVSSITYAFRSNSVVVQKASIHVKTRIPLVLTQDIVKLGTKGDEVQVARGYARNYLLPRKLAVYATDQNKKLFPTSTNIADQSLKAQEAAAKKASDRISKVNILLRRNAAAGDIVAKPVTQLDIRQKLFKQEIILLAPEEVKLSQPLTTFGDHTVPILIQGIQLPLRIQVVRQ